MPRAIIDRSWKRILWIAALALLAYLPAALQLTYYRDDWYYAYDAMVGPTGVFRYMFAGDRPARGPFFELYFALFGIAPTPYHLAMLFWRIAGGAAAAWLFHLLWPRRHAAGLVAGAIFALYPGFTWWVQGIEYQPMVASAALMVVSLCLTVQALRVQRKWTRALCMAGAVLTAWVYLALVEYAAGMELFRIAVIFAALDEARFRSRLLAALRAWLPYLIIPLGFGIWRFLYFTSERKATDLGLQLAGFLADPLSTGLHWLMSFLLSFVNVTLAAWVQPLQNSFFSLRLREQIPALGFALVAGALLWLLLRRADAEAPLQPRRQDTDWQLAAIWLGLAAIVLGIAPIVAANRQITLPNFSHYALPASLGAAFLVVGLIDLLSNRSVQVAASAALVALSVLTLQGLGASALREERIIANFWHQMAWRAAGIEPGTTLLIRYPDVDYGSDSDVVWGPANFVYYPLRQDELPVQLQISAFTDEENAADAVLRRSGEQRSTYRSHTMVTDPGRLLLVSQPTTQACVNVMSSQTPSFSIHENALMRVLAPFSRSDGVIAAASSGAAAQLPESVFGPEPEHGWCYYFQRAARAATTRDWQRVAGLYDEAGRLGLQPNDQIEWLPFLIAQAHLGNERAVRDIASRLNIEPDYRHQACDSIPSAAPLPSEMLSTVNELLRCSAQP